MPVRLREISGNIVQYIGGTSGMLHSSLELRAQLPDNDLHVVQGVAHMENESEKGEDIAGEEYLVNLWRTQLNSPQIGVRDDFFAAGGSSMQVIEMLMTVSNKYGREIDFAAFFEEPCIYRLNELLTN
jgi:Phosphopantetheine attachment site